MFVPFSAVWISFVLFCVCASVRANGEIRKGQCYQLTWVRRHSHCLSASSLFSRHTSQFQTRRRIWTLSTPPLSVNSHSLTFTSRHSSCGPNKFSPWACVVCGLLVKEGLVFPLFVGLPPNNLYQHVWEYQLSWHTNFGSPLGQGVGILMI